MSVKHIISTRLSAIFNNCIDHLSNNWDGDISFEEIQHIDEFDLLDSICQGGYIKIHDRQTGDIYWLSGIEYDMVTVYDSIEEIDA